MKPSFSLEANRDAVHALVAKYRVANPRVFGSVARGDDNEGSDLDILVDTLPATTLFDLCGLQAELETLLGVKVDVATPGELRPRIFKRVMAEAEPL